jgi:hypothetical protein
LSLLESATFYKIDGMNGGTSGSSTIRWVRPSKIWRMKRAIFRRLRVGSHGVVFEYQIIGGSRVSTCVFAGPRKWIYEIFQSRLLD